MMIGYDIYDCYNGAFSIASKNDLDDQNLLLATVSGVSYKFLKYYYINSIKN
jgi:hypothetical protein